MKKRLLLLLLVPILLFGIYLSVILIAVIVIESETDTPENIGSFNVVETSTIDPT
jgi:hypothetical protein